MASDTSEQSAQEHHTMIAGWIVDAGPFLKPALFGALIIIVIYAWRKLA